MVTKPRKKKYIRLAVRPETVGRLRLIRVVRGWNGPECVERLVRAYLEGDGSDIKSTWPGAFSNPMKGAADDQSS